MQVYLFGNFRIATDTHSELALRPTAARLFAFLLLYRHNVHQREVVAESFWGHAEIYRARKSLNTTLWQLRNALRQRDRQLSKVIKATPEQIRIDQKAKLWLDVALFEDTAKQGLAYAKAGRVEASVETLKATVTLYQGDLLHGFYDPWVLQERERLRLLYLRCLTQLTTAHHQQQNLEASIVYAQRILGVEPWREDIHRTLMSLYAENGRRARAIQQFQTCRQILASELAVRPSAETEALHQQLLTNVPSIQSQTVSMPSQPSVATGRVAKEPTLQGATAQLRTAMQTMHEAQIALEQAVALVKLVTLKSPTDLVTLPPSHNAATVESGLIVA